MCINFIKNVWKQMKCFGFFFLQYFVFILIKLVISLPLVVSLECEGKMLPAC